MTAQTKVTISEARAALEAGKRIKCRVGMEESDPVVVLRLEDGVVMCEAVAGWSAGVDEPMCGFGSDYWRFALARYETAEIIEGSGWQ